MTPSPNQSRGAEDGRIGNVSVSSQPRAAKPVTAVEPWEAIVKKLSDLNPFIAYLEATKPSDWLCDVVRDRGNRRNCVMGHLVNWYYGKGYTGSISPAWDWFEEIWATTYMIYPVNDGNPPEWMNHRYDQPTAKERVIAYLKNLRDGKEETTQQLWESEARKHEKVTDLVATDPDAKSSLSNPPNNQP